jgi:(p)ppGpp synthase/HD superfamily hydrolase
MNVTYAQTNIQLFNQLHRDGYSPTELALICDAYRLAIRLYSGYFLSSGRTEIAHVVGTASILGVLEAPAPVVTAGLIHNAYDNGDFGSYRYGVTAAKQKVIVQAVGKEVESYVQGFHILRTKLPSLSALIGDIEKVDSIERFALLIELSERLEHHLNDGGLPNYTKYMGSNGHIMADVAQKLEFPRLATAIQDATKDSTVDSSIVTELAARSRGNRSPWIVPASCRKTFTAAMIHGFRRVGRNGIVRRGRRLFGNLKLAK